MFRGQFLHTIDVKGRVSLPSRYRDAIASQGGSCLIVTPAPFEPCLHIYPLVEWELFEKKVAEFSNWDRDIVHFRRIYVSAAIECEVDRNGRVVIPPHLRDKAELEKEVLWVGMGRIAEIWSKSRWDNAISLNQEQMTAFKKSVMETIRI